MPKSYLKGETTTIKTRFPVSVTVVGAPTWVLYDWEDEELVSGTAVQTPDHMWVAEFTLPKNLVIPNGEQELSITYSAVDVNDVRHTRSKTLLVVDGLAQWQDVGELVHSGDTSISTVIFLPTQATSISITLREGYGDTPINVASSTLNAPTYDTITSAGFGYNLSLALTSALTTQSNSGLQPYQLFIESTFSGGRKDRVIKPVYVLTPRVTTLVTNMTRYLDKARLDDIDKALQWSVEELVHFLTRGVSFINSIGEASYWTLSAFPPNLDNHIFTAACYEALNARFLAEGMNSFEFQGANTQLTFNRREAIQTKMDELRGILDSYLLPAKTAAIRIFGPGTPPLGGMTPTPNSLGTIGISIHPNTNRHRWLSQGGEVNDRGFRFF